MTKLITKKEIIPITLILIMFGFGFSLYNCLPEQIPTHWNIQGQVDGWSSKNFAVFFFPAITLGLYLLLLFLPLIDPLRENYQKFSNVYYGIRLALILFMALLYFYTLLAGLGFEMNINYFIVPLMSGLFVVLGIFMPRIKKNWFCGIRTPWTLQSDEVWEKTHKYAGKVFINIGILSAFTMVLGRSAFWVFMIIVIVGALSPVVYSYLLYRKMGLFKKTNRS